MPNICQLGHIVYPHMCGHTIYPRTIYYIHMCTHSPIYIYTVAIWGMYGYCMYTYVYITTLYVWVVIYTRYIPAAYNAYMDMRLLRLSIRVYTRIYVLVAHTYIRAHILYTCAYIWYMIAICVGYILGYTIYPTA